MSPDPEIMVLAVDDDPTIRELLEDYLGANQYRVFTAANSAEARAVLAEHLPHIVILDIGLPGEDGLSLARFIREQYDIAIVIVSGAGETVDRIVGLEVGADDYIGKPFDLRELRARLKSVLRRYHRDGGNPAPAADPTPQRRVAFGASWLDLDSRQLFDRAGQEIAITSTEFDLLKVFAERPNRPLSRDQLMTLTRNRDWDPFDRSIDIRIARLRRKVEEDPENPRTIKTMRGVGYMFVPPARAG
ncbi:MAG: response regulator [Gammaproteobacteria bacterium]